MHRTRVKATTIVLAALGLALVALGAVVAIGWLVLAGVVLWLAAACGHVRWLRAGRRWL